MSENITSEMICICHMHVVGEDIFINNLKRNKKKYLIINYFDKLDNKTIDSIHNKECTKILTIIKNQNK